MTEEKQTGIHHSHSPQTKRRRHKFDRLSEVLLQVFDDEADDACPDTEGIGYYLVGDREWIGYIESVNGREAKSCDYQYLTTDHELRVLAKYWYRELTNIDLTWFLHQTTSSTEWRTAVYATRRLHRIRRNIGDSLFHDAIAEIDAEFRQKLGDAKWEQFKAQR